MKEKTAEDTEETQEEVESHPSSTPSNTRNGIILGAGAMLVLIAAVGGAYMFGLSQQKKTTSSTDITPLSTNAVAPSSAPGVTSVTAVTLQKYESPHAKGFNFSYDPAIWTITKQPDGTSTSLVLQHTASDDQLTFAYDLPFGRGGGLSTIKAGELIKVADTTDLYRLETNYSGKKKFEYGHANPDKSSPVVLFKNDSSKYQEAIDHCKEIESGAAMMQMYSAEQCEQIKSGVILGYAQQPTFSWSIKAQTTVPLAQIHAQWGSDDYIKQNNMDDGSILILTSFEGTHVEDADEIVSQLKSL